MAVTNDNIRALLNRPRGLLEETITEYISIRTLEVDKKARSATLYGVTASNAVTTDLKEAAIKSLVAMDCLSVMVDTIPSYYPAKEQGPIEQRLRSQLKVFKERSDNLVKEIASKGGTAFATKKTNTRLDSSDSTYNEG
jgi:hypothetical protein